MCHLHNKIKDRKNGSALIGVLCVMCIFATLALSMLFAAYQVLHHSQQIMTKEQCHVLADTFSREVSGEITNAKDDTNGLRGYIKTSMEADGWTYYDEEEDGHAKKDVMKLIETQMSDSELEKKSGTLEIGLYWKKVGGSEAYENRVLVAEVTAKLRGEQYQIVNEYRLKPDSVSEGAQWVWYADSARAGGGS